MSITHSTRVADRIATVTARTAISGLTVGAVPAITDPGPGPGRPCCFQGCQGPGQRALGPGGWRDGPGGGVLDPGFGNWGFWTFGVWFPL